MVPLLGGTREAGKNNWTACEAPGRHQGGRKKPFGQPGRRQGGTRETCSTGLPIEFRFWKGAGFCLTLIQFQCRSARFAAHPGVGGLHGRLPSRDWKGLFGQPERHQEGRKGLIGQLARRQGGTREAGKNQESIGQCREAPGRQERTIWTAWKSPLRSKGFGVQ